MFLTQTGDQIFTASTVHECIQRTYTASGTQAKYPQHINCTANRNLVTSAARDQNSANATLVTAQLCHSVAQGDRIYRLQAKRQQSAEAVRVTSKAVEQSAVYQSQTVLASEVFDAPASAPNPIHDESTRHLWQRSIQITMEEPVPEKPGEQAQEGTSGAQVTQCN